MRFFLVLLLLPFAVFSQKDTSKVGFKKFVQSTLCSGQVSVGYDYGLLPFLVSENPIQGNFKTEGRLGITAFEFPFDLSYYYSNLGTISGFNNHFTFRFNYQLFQQNLKKKMLADKLNSKEVIDSLEHVNQNLQKKLNYLQLLKSNQIAVPIELPKDTLAFSTDLPIDSLLPENTPLIGASLDSATVPTSYLTWNDSLEQVLSGLSSTIESTETRIDQLRQFSNVNTDSLLNAGALPSSYFPNKAAELLGYVKKFDVGMTYPNYSEFLVARIPIRGVNFELEKDKFYLAFTHGKTVNNIFFTNNLIANNLNSARNLYNFFNFNNIEDGRRVSSLKVGYGKKNETHLHVGLLYGLGKVSYQDTSFLADRESNLVAEIDGRVSIGKKQFVEVNYGRSAIQVNNVNLENEASLMDAVLDFSQRTNAVMVKYGARLKKTKLKASWRFIDPFFRSFGVGFIRSDNVRYQLKVDQQVSKKFKLGAFVRKENDNVLGIYNYQNHLLSYGLNSTWRPTKRWMLKLDYRPIVHQVESSFDSLALQNNNWIINAVANYNNRVDETYFFATGIYSYYQLFTGNGNNAYQNINASLSIQHKQSIRNELIFNYFSTTDTASSPIAYILQNDFSFIKSASSITGLVKCAFLADGLDLGYGLKATIPISKNISFEASAEKLVYGDFYNSMFGSSFYEFPYFISTSIKINW